MVPPWPSQRAATFGRLPAVGPGFDLRSGRAAHHTRCPTHNEEGRVTRPSSLCVIFSGVAGLLSLALTLDLIETGAAVNRPVIPGQERHGCFSTALRADHRVHLTGIAPRTLATTGGSTSRTSLRLVHESLFREELLFAYSEHELLRTVAALQGFVRKAHFSLTPFTCGEVWSQFSLCRIRTRDALPKNQDQGPPGRDCLNVPTVQ